MCDGRKLQCKESIWIRGRKFECCLSLGHEGKHKSLEDWGGPFFRDGVGVVEIRWSTEKVVKYCTQYGKEMDG